MTSSERPFALPEKLGRDLARILTVWEGLKRGEAEMPFWDDVDIASLPELSDRLIMIDALGKPVRFRFSFGTVGADVKREYGGDLDGRFLDEIEVRHPLQFLMSQLSATAESRQPTFYRHAAGPGGAQAKRRYARLLVPLWGEGGVGLLGAFAWE